MGREAGGDRREPTAGIGLRRDPVGASIHPGQFRAAMRIGIDR